MFKTVTFMESKRKNESGPWMGVALARIAEGGRDDA
jgi:hypothetical protein